MHGLHCNQTAPPLPLQTEEKSGFGVRIFEEYSVKMTHTSTEEFSS